MLCYRSKYQIYNGFASILLSPAQLYQLYNHYAVIVRFDFGFYSFPPNSSFHWLLSLLNAHTPNSFRGSLFLLVCNSRLILLYIGRAVLISMFLCKFKYDSIPRSIRVHTEILSERRKRSRRQQSFTRESCGECYSSWVRICIWVNIILVWWTLAPLAWLLCRNRAPSDPSLHNVSFCVSSYTWLNRFYIHRLLCKYAPHTWREGGRM